MTDHGVTIAALRRHCRSDTCPDLSDDEVWSLLAADLLELHDQTGISLDGWISAREFVERLVGHEIKENKA